MMTAGQLSMFRNLLGFAVLLAALSANGQASGLLKDFDTLGGNDVLLERAKALNPDATIRVVQDRVVSRRKRVELSPEYSNVLGGDSYNMTHNIGVNAHFHFTPQWSMGLKYNYSFNQLRPEGQFLIEDGVGAGQPIIPDIDFPKSQALALINWYPIYGKMNLYDLGVAHFDIYAIVGGGQIDLKSGSSATYTAGGGVGLWISQHLSTRFEMRYQNYRAVRYTGAVDMHTTVAGIQFGYLL
jgi:outer membrane immunogenic protein